MRRVQIIKELKQFFSVTKFAFVLILLGISTILSVLYPFIYKYFIDRVLFEKSIANFKVVFLLMVLWLLGNTLVKYVLSRERTGFLVEMLIKIKSRLFENAAHRRLNFYLQKTANEMKHVIEDDSNEIEGFFLKDVFEFALCTLNVFVLVFVMAAISLPLLIGCMGFFCLSYLEAKLIKRMVNVNAKALRSALAEEDHVRMDELKNYREIRCLNYEDVVVEAFHMRSSHLIQLITKEKIYLYINKYLSALNHDLITRFFIYMLGGVLVVNDYLSISSFLIFLGFYENFVKNTRKIMDSNFNLNSRMNKLENILEYLNWKDDCDSGEEYRIEQVEFSGVCFQYPGSRSDCYVLENFHACLKRGRIYLIQGKSGAGKSTILKLLCREFEQFEGEIDINGKALTEYQDYPGYYRRLAVASCDSRLFNGSLRENLLFAAPSADDEMLHRACANAQLTADITRMSAGLDSPVGENGGALSGGQRERLILARLFLQHADLYLLDEALDEISIDDEVKILDLLRIINKDSIIVVISHRLESYVGAEYMQIG